MCPRTTLVGQGVATITSNLVGIQRCHSGSLSVHYCFKPEETAITNINMFQFMLTIEYKEFNEPLLNGRRLLCSNIAISPLECVARHSLFVSSMVTLDLGHLKPEVTSGLYSFYKKRADGISITS